MSSQTLNRLFTILAFLLVSKMGHAAQRPFYIIGHMVNSIEQIAYYLDLGANVIESDIQFFPNGTVDLVYHGFPCDCFRTCSRNAKLPEFLMHIRKITDPSSRKNYADKMVMQFFDLKLSNVRDKHRAGQEIARHVLDYLWDKDNDKRPRMKALIYINSVSDIDAIVGFRETFKSRGVEDLLKDIGYDGGVGDVQEIHRMFEYLDIKENIWQGDGKSNCFSPLYPDGRLRRQIEMRNSKQMTVDKVYHWTIDLKIRMRLSLNLGVDGFITNDPDDVVEVLQEADYRKDFRIATPKDNPFERFIKK